MTDIILDSKPKREKGGGLKSSRRRTESVESCGEQIPALCLQFPEGWLVDSGPSRVIDSSS